MVCSFLSFLVAPPWQNMCSRLDPFKDTRTHSGLTLSRHDHRSMALEFMAVTLAGPVRYNIGLM